MKKSLKIIIITASILLVLIIILAVSPIIAKNYIVNNSKELVGRKLDIKDLSVNYFTSTVSIKGFTMFEANDATPFTSFKELKLNSNLFNLLFSKITIESLSIKGLETHIIQNDSIFNFNDLINFYSTSNDTLEKNTDPIKFSIESIRLSSSKLIYDDESLNNTLQLDSINITMPSYKYNQTTNSQAQLSFILNNTGICNSSVSINPSNGLYEALINVTQLNIAPFLPYSKDYIAVKQMEGFLNSNLNIKGNINNTESIEIKGNSSVKNLALYSLDAVKIMGASNIKASFSSLKPLQGSYVLDNIELHEPYTYFQLRDSLSNNFEDLLAPYQTSTTNSDTNTESDSLYYFIKSLDISRGKLLYADSTTPETFKYNLSDVEIHTDSIASNMNWIDVKAKSILTNKGELIAELGIDLNNVSNLELHYLIKDFQLTDLNIYSKHYAGFPLLQGDMYYKGDLSIKDKQIVSENKLLIEDVKVGKKAKGLYSLPLKFAIFLLKDKNGDIKLNIPVRGDLNNPKITIWKIVWKTVKNLITRTASAPTNQLASLVGANPKDLKNLEFEYTDSILSKKHIKTLDALLKLEQEKEGLRISLKHFNDILKEEQYIAIIEVKKLFNSNNYNNIKDDDNDFIAFIKQQTGKDTISLKDDCFSIIGSEKLKPLLRSIGTQRHNAINNYLLSKNNSTKIKVKSFYIDSPKNIASKPVYEIEFSEK